MTYENYCNNSVGCKKGFTLIELLVVVAIIAVLVSILLPSLQKARDRAKTIVCMNNVRTFGTCYQLYASEYNDWLPMVMDNLIKDYPGTYDGRYRWYISFKRHDYCTRETLLCPMGPLWLGYGMNQWINMNEWKYQLNRYDRPSRVVLLADANEYEGSSVSAKIVPDEWNPARNWHISRRHGGKAVTLFGDLHVEMYGFFSLYNDDIEWLKP